MLPVVVLGAGIIGASIAWRLAQAGRRVTIFDAGRVGAEASWAGAGILAPGSEFEAPSIWADLGGESMTLYPAFIDELRAESGLAIDLQMYSQDGLVDPRDVMRALHTALAARGVDIREKTPIANLDTEAATAVVIAAGAWSSGISLRYHGQPVHLPESFPVKGHLIAYQLRPGLLGPIRRSGHTYLLQRSNGVVIAGSTEERIGFDRSIDSRICLRLHRRAAALWPELKGKLFDECWIGFRPGTATGLPRIEPVGDTNAWLAYGHYRNGILLAPVTAQKIANDIISSSGTG